MPSLSVITIFFLLQLTVLFGHIALVLHLIYKPSVGSQPVSTHQEDQRPARPSPDQSKESLKLCSYRKFIIVTQQRSGSSHLGSLLGNHSSIKCSSWEPMLQVQRFCGTKNLTFAEVSKLLFGSWEYAWVVQKMKGESASTVGFKLMYDQGVLQYGPELFKMLEVLGVKVIHLIRQDKLLQYISVQTNRHDGKIQGKLGHVAHAETKGVAAMLRNQSLAALDGNPEIVLRYLRKRSAEDTLVSKYLATSMSASNVHTIYYENLSHSERSRPELGRLFTFLGVREEAVFSRYVKVIHGLPASSYFATKDREGLKEALSKSEFSKFLGDWE